MEMVRSSMTAGALREADRLRRATEPGRRRYADGLPAKSLAGKTLEEKLRWYHMGFFNTLRKHHETILTSWIDLGSMVTVNSFGAVSPGKSLGSATKCLPTRLLSLLKKSTRSAKRAAKTLSN